jgi:hypothetical protein
MGKQRRLLQAGVGVLPPLPAHYADFDLVSVDLDPMNGPDRMADVCDLASFADESFDAVYGADLLEHFAPWEISQVLGELTRVLRVGGYLEIRVPFGEAVFRALSEGHPLDAPLYESEQGPRTPHDVLYGHGDSIRAGQAARAHRTVFTTRSLRRALSEVGLREELLMPTDGMGYTLSLIGRRIAVSVPELSPEDLAEAMLAL